jgi:hypothetical protein
MLIAFIVIFLILGVLIGNVTAMKILSNMGISVFSGKPLRDYKVMKSVNADVIGWIQIPNTCYNPIMLSKDGFYTNHNSKGVESKRGEIFLTTGHNAYDLDHIAKPSNNGFKDLSVFKGTATSRLESMRESKFTYLKKYINSDLKKTNPDICIVDNGKLRLFNLLFAVELGLEDRKAFKFTDRASFLATMRKGAFLDTLAPTDNDIIILNGSTGIDTMLVFLVEKEGYVDVKSE